MRLFVAGVLLFFLGASWGQFTGGKGTSSEPFKICTAEQLDSVRFYLDKHFALTNDINLKSNDHWKPIGTITAPFTGSINGNNFSIKNMSVVVQDSLGGFFSIIDSARIINLKLTNINILGNNVIGGLSAICSSSEVKNVHVTGKINAFHGVGGIIGKSLKNSRLVLSSFEGKIELNVAAGGLVYYNEHSTIDSCYSKVSIFGNANMGGLVAINYENAIIDHSHSTARLINISQNGTSNFGGLVGANINSQILNSQSNSTQIQGHENLGGISGKNSYNSKILGCTASGEILGRRNIGGIVGSNIFSKVKQASAIVTITCNGSCGGLIGMQRSGSIEESYFDGTITGSN